MSASPDNVHPRADRILDYFEARLKEEDESALEDHFAECVACVAIAREVHSFHELWDWSPQQHARAHLRDAMSGALVLAAGPSVSKAVQARLVRWRKRWAGRAEAALKMVLSASERAVVEAVEMLARPGSAWRFAEQPAAAAVRGVSDPDQGSVVLATSVESGEMRVRVAIHAADTGEVVVRIDDPSVHRACPLVLLTGRDTDGEPLVIVREPRREPGTNYGVARFEDLPAGEYLIAFEPFEE